MKIGPDRAARITFHTTAAEAEMAADAAQADGLVPPGCSRSCCPRTPGGHSCVK